MRLLGAVIDIVWSLNSYTRFTGAQFPAGWKVVADNPFIAWDFKQVE
jgi:hypothetical protein